MEIESYKLSFERQNLVSLIFTFLRRDKTARSVPILTKDRIIFSNIQIHCCCCFELPIKISYHYEEFHSSYDILSIFFMVKHPTLVKKQRNDHQIIPK